MSMPSSSDAVAHTKLDLALLELPFGLVTPLVGHAPVVGHDLLFTDLP